VGGLLRAGLPVAPVDGEFAREGGGGLGAEVQLEEPVVFEAVDRRHEVGVGRERDPGPARPVEAAPGPRLPGEAHQPQRTRAVGQDDPDIDLGDGQGVVEVGRPHRSGSPGAGSLAQVGQPLPGGVQGVHVAPGPARTPPMTRGKRASTRRRVRTANRCWARRRETSEKYSASSWAEVATRTRASMAMICQSRSVRSQRRRSSCLAVTEVLMTSPRRPPRHSRAFSKMNPPRPARTLRSTRHEANPDAKTHQRRGRAHDDRRRPTGPPPTRRVCRAWMATSTSARSVP